jgi:hypothetical protein
MGLGIDQRGLARNRDHLLGSADLQIEVEFGGGSRVHVQWGRYLRGHVGSDGTRGILPGRQEFKHKLPCGIAGDKVAKALGGVHQSDGSVDNPAARGIDHSAANRSGGGVLRGGRNCHQDDESEKQPLKTGTQRQKARHRTSPANLTVSPDQTGDSFCISPRGVLCLCGGSFFFRVVPRWEN